MSTLTTILIVEDEPSIRTVLAEKLKHEGFEVFQAANGEEGLVMAKEHAPKLILLDVVMPRMDGMSMLKKLREQEAEHPNSAAARVIMLTNSDDTSNVAESLEQGAYDFLVKSDWKLEDVVEKVRSVLGMAS